MMWSRLAFLLFVGATVAWEGPWKARKQFKFDVFASTYTGIPDLRDQYTGVVSRGQLIFQAQNENTIVGHLTGLQDGSFHGDMETSFNARIPYERVQYLESKLNNKPFRLNLNSGIVESLEVDNSMTNDEVNLLKAYLTQLQIDIYGKNVIESPHNQLPSNDPKPSGLFRTMEASITGHCETIYEISPIADFMLSDSYPHWEPDTSNQNAEDYFQIVRTMNYSNCATKRGYHHGIWADSTSLKVNSNQMGDFQSKATIGRIVASGSLDDITVHYSASITKVSGIPELHQKQQAKVVSIVELILVESGDFESPLPEPNSAVNVGSLVYRYNIPSDLKNTIRDGSDTDVENVDQVDSGEVFNVPWSTRDHVNVPNQRNVQGGSNWIQQLRGSSDLAQQVSKRPDKYWQPIPTMDEAPEHPFFPYLVGYQGHGIQYAVKIETEIKKLVDEISEDVTDRSKIADKNVLEKYKILVDLITASSFKQLETVDKEFDGGKRSDGYHWIVYRDAIAAAGTGPAISIIEKWITSGRLEGTAAVQVLANQPRVIRTPTEEHVIAFMRIVKSQPVQSNSAVYIASVLAVTDLVNRAFSNFQVARTYYPVDSYGPFHYNLSQIVFTQVVPYFEDALQTAVQQKNDHDVLVHIRALANTGHQIYLTTFKKYFESENEFTPFQRAAAVLAFDNLAQNDPELIRGVLHKIYQNIAEEPEIRAAAVVLLIRTDPPTAMLQKIASFTYEDPSEQVQSVVQSTIEEVAELQAPHDQLRAAKAESARQFLNPRSYPNGFTRVNLTEYFLNGLNFVRQQQFGYIASRDSAVPRFGQFKSYHHSGGVITAAVEIEAAVSSFKDLMQYFVRPVVTPFDDHSYPSEWNVDGSSDSFSVENFSSEENSSENSQPSYAVNVLKSILKKVSDKFERLFSNRKNHYSQNKVSAVSNKKYGKIFRNKPTHEDIERGEEERLQGQIYNEFLGGRRFFAFDKDTIGKFPQQVSDVIASYSNGKQVHYNKFYNVRSVAVGFPLAAGHIYFYSYDSPVLVQIDGNVKIEVNPPTSSQKSVVMLPETANVTASVNLVYSRNHITHTGFITPFSGQSYVAGHVRKTLFHAPLNVQIDASLKDQQFETQVSPQHPNEDATLAHFSSWPYTVQRDVFSLRPDAEQPGKKPIHTRDPKEVNRRIGENSSGFVVHLKGKYEAPAENNGPIPLFLGNYRKNLFNGIFLPAEGLEMYKLEAQYDGQRTKASTINLGFSIRSQTIHSQDTVKTQQEAIRGLPQNYPGIKSGQPLSRESTWLYGSASGMSNAWSTVVKAWVNFTEPNANSFYSTYEATAVYTRSQPLELSRFYAAARFSEQNKKDEQQYCLAAVVKQDANNHFASSSLEQALKVSHLLGAEFKLAVGSDCNQEGANTEVHGVVLIDQTENFRDYIREIPEAHQCEVEMKEGNYLMPGCRKAIRRARIPNSIVFDIQKKGNTQHGNQEHVEVLQRLASYLPGTKYHRFDVNDRISGMLEMNGGMDYYNGTIKYKNHEYEVNELEISPWLRDIFIYGEARNVPILRIVPRQSTCVLDKSKILTFDQRVIDQPIGHCGYMMTVREVPNYPSSPDVKDRRRYVSVLVGDEASVAHMREVAILVEQDNGDLQMVQILGLGKDLRPSVIVWKDDSSNPSPIPPNEHFQVIDNGVSRIHIHPASQDDDNVVVVAVHEGSMHIHFDGERVKVVVDSSYRNELRGLCGTNDLEQFTDMVSPRNCHHHNPKYFTNSWSMTTKEAYCSSEVEQEKAESLKALCHPIEYIRNTVVSPYEAGIGPFHSGSRQYQRQNKQKSDSSGFGDGSTQWKSVRQLDTTSVSCELRNQTQYVEENNQICFSTKGLYSCPRHCVSNPREKHTVPVYCFNKNDPIAVLNKQLIRKGKNLHWGEHSVTKNVVFNVPKVCREH